MQESSAIPSLADIGGIRFDSPRPFGIDPRSPLPPLDGTMSPSAFLNGYDAPLNNDLLNLDSPSAASLAASTLSLATPLASPTQSLATPTSGFRAMRLDTPSPSMRNSSVSFSFPPFDPTLPGIAEDAKTCPSINVSDVSAELLRATSPVTASEVPIELLISSIFYAVASMPPLFAFRNPFSMLSVNESQNAYLFLVNMQLFFEELFVAGRFPFILNLKVDDEHTFFRTIVEPYLGRVDVMNRIKFHIPATHYPGYAVINLSSEIKPYVRKIMQDVNSMGILDWSLIRAQKIKVEPTPDLLQVSPDMIKCVAWVWQMFNHKGKFNPRQHILGPCWCCLGIQFE